MFLITVFQCKHRCGLYKLPTSCGQPLHTLILTLAFCSLPRKWQGNLTFANICLKNNGKYVCPTFMWPCTCKWSFHFTLSIKSTAEPLILFCSLIKWQRQISLFQDYSFLHITAVSHLILKPKGLNNAGLGLAEANSGEMSLYPTWARWQDKFSCPPAHVG